MRHLWCIAPLLVACGSYESADNALNEGNGPFFDDSLDSYVRVHVLPVGDNELTGQSFLAFADNDLRLVMTPTIALSGYVHGSAVTPWRTAADLPGAQGPIVGATVRLSRSEGIHAPSATTDTDGFYLLDLVPGPAPYRLHVVPLAANTPFTSTEITLDGSNAVLDIDLGEGVALFGRALGDTDGLPALVGVEVYAVDELGVRGPSTLTDEQGWYQLRVSPGTSYAVVTTGDGPGRVDLRSPWFEVGDHGQEVPLMVPRPSAFFTEGLVVDQDGSPIEGATVELRATSIDGFDTDTGTASYVVSDQTNQHGQYIVSVLPGTYDLRVVPDDADLPARMQRSAALREGLRPSLGSGLDTIALPNLRRSEFVVVGDDGVGVDGADLTCTETQFDRRAWSATSEADGTLTIELPITDVVCRLAPPVSRPDLAFTYIDMNTSNTPDLLRFGTPHTLRGTVLRTQTWSDDAAEANRSVPNAIVEIRDNNDRILAATFTDSAGDFAVQIALLPDEEPD